MSRTGKKEITIPQGVEVKLNNNLVHIKGPKESIERDIHHAVKIEHEDNALRVKPRVDDNDTRKFHGLSRSLLNNMVVGVTEGFSKSLTLKGVGYRAALKGKELHLTLGYSHPIHYKIPEGIEIKVDKQTTVVVSGIDKELVGQVAANIRAYRKPEPYHGKGVRYTDEVILTKAGKAGAKK